jgi:predicted NUDIX family NTP pyrophosphohydrolase
MSKISCGLLMYRLQRAGVQVLLVHPGGPFFRNKDEGSWTIPKGEPNEGEDLLAAACREFAEETGIIPAGPYTSLGTVKQKGGKVVHGWAFAGDCDPAKMKSNSFEMEWPPKSGRKQLFPEIDRGEWFDLLAARQKINPAQADLLGPLETLRG